MTLTKHSAAFPPGIDAVCLTSGDRFELLRLVKAVAPALGLKAPVLATLEAMLSYLPKSRRHNVVFASNETLLQRIGGLTERSLRRHVQRLAEAGLLNRIDSPNRKRFIRHNGAGDAALRFGFDLSPAFARLSELQALANHLQQRAAETAFERQALRVRLSRCLQQDPSNSVLKGLLNRLRSHPDLNELADIARQLPPDTPPAPVQPDDTPRELSGNDGQNDRHHYSSDKEVKNNKTDDLSIEELKTSCPTAAELAVDAVENEADAIGHAQMLAPMLGISLHDYHKACQLRGSWRIAQTIWWLTGRVGVIRNLKAYFLALIFGRRSAEFSPQRAIRFCPDPGRSQTMIVRGQ